MAASLFLFATLSAAALLQGASHCSTEGLPIRCSRVGRGPSRICGGRTEITNWIARQGGEKERGVGVRGGPAAEIVARVRATHCGFRSLPSFAASIVVSPLPPPKERREEAESVLAAVSASLVIVRPSAGGFDAILRHVGMSSKQLLALATGDADRRGGWQVSWLGDAGGRSGSTVLGTSGWAEQHRAGSGSGAAGRRLFIDVDTRLARAHLSSGSTPLFLPSLVVGRYAHFPHALVPTGTSIVFQASAAGFRVFLDVQRNTAAAAADAASEQHWQDMRRASSGSTGGAELFAMAADAVAKDDPLSAQDVERLGWAVSWIAVDTGAQGTAGVVDPALANAGFASGAATTQPPLADLGLPPLWRGPDAGGSSGPGRAWRLPGDGHVAAGWSNAKWRVTDAAAVDESGRSSSGSSSSSSSSSSSGSSSASAARRGRDRCPSLRVSTLRAKFSAACDPDFPAAEDGGCLATSAPALVGALYGGRHPRPLLLHHGGDGRLLGGGIALFGTTGAGFEMRLRRLHPPWAATAAHAVAQLEAASHGEVGAAAAAKARVAAAAAAARAAHEQAADAHWLHLYGWRAVYVGYDGEWPADCAMGAWGAWSTCTVMCGDSGRRSRTRSIIQIPRGGGLACGATTVHQACNQHHCTVDCIAGPWAAWSAGPGVDPGVCFADVFQGVCTPTSWRRARKVAVAAIAGGKPCPRLAEEKPCALECLGAAPSAAPAAATAGAACKHGGAGGGLCGGSAGRAGLGWEALGGWAITLRVDAAACGFARTPQYIFNLAIAVAGVVGEQAGRGDTRAEADDAAAAAAALPLLYGVGVVFSPRRDGFRVILDGRDVHLSSGVVHAAALLRWARRGRWSVRWAGAAGSTGGCSAQGATGWVSQAAGTSGGGDGEVCATAGHGAAATDGATVLAAVQVPIPSAVPVRSLRFDRHRCPWCVRGNGVVQATATTAGNSFRTCARGRASYAASDHAGAIADNAAGKVADKLHWTVSWIRVAVSRTAGAKLSSEWASRKHGGRHTFSAPLPLPRAAPPSYPNGSGDNGGGGRSVVLLSAWSPPARATAWLGPIILPRGIHKGSGGHGGSGGGGTGQLAREPLLFQERVALHANTASTASSIGISTLAIATGSCASGGGPRTTHESNKQEKHKNSRAVGRVCKAGYFLLESVFAEPALFSALPTAHTAFHGQCLPCNAGRYQPTAGAVADTDSAAVLGCMMCPVGSWSHRQGSVACSTGAPTAAPTPSPTPPSWSLLAHEDEGLPLAAPGEPPDRAARVFAAERAALRREAARATAADHDRDEIQTPFTPPLPQPQHSMPGAHALLLVLALLALLPLALGRCSRKEPLPTPAFDPFLELDKLDALDGRRGGGSGGEEQRSLLAELQPPTTLPAPRVALPSMAELMASSKPRGAALERQLQLNDDAI
jgi:hypothetical protein